MIYLDDFEVGTDVDIYFPTNGADGAAITATITAANIKIYKDGADSGITVDADELFIDFEGAGNHRIRLDVSDHAAIYSAGSDFGVVLTTGTVDTKTVRTTLAQFSSQNRYRGGVKLASDGLDSIAITQPAGVASNFREMMVQVWRRLFKKATASATELKVYKDNDSVATTQTISEAAGTRTVGNAS